jgi:RNA polymerase sigma-70 factor (ECF subfamily)
MSSVTERDEHRLIERLRAGDERAFAELVDLHHAGMLRFARTFVPSEAVAEEVVQDAWAALVKGVERFEGRSSVKTWLYRVVANRASTTGVREHRTVPLSSLGSAEDDDGPSVSPERFSDGMWSSAPRPWEDAERRLESLELREELRTALEGLPPRQRLVVVLRDVEGLATEEVQELLDISEANQRVLLHRGRSRLRQALEDAQAAA